MGVVLERQSGSFWSLLYFPFVIFEFNFGAVDFLFLF